MAKLKPLEKHTERKSVAYALGHDCVVYKGNGLGRMAKPDRIIVTWNGYVWFVEFKREGEELTKLQMRERESLLERGQLYSVITSFEQFQFHLEWILKLPTRKIPAGW